MVGDYLVMGFVMVGILILIFVIGLVLILIFVLIFGVFVVGGFGIYFNIGMSLYNMILLVVMLVLL